MAQIISATLCQVAKGMKYLADLGIIHRDVALRNMLLTNKKLVVSNKLLINKSYSLTKGYLSTMIYSLTSF